MEIGQSISIFVRLHVAAQMLPIIDHLGSHECAVFQPLCALGAIIVESNCHAWSGKSFLFTFLTSRFEADAQTDAQTHLVGWMQVDHT